MLFDVTPGNRAPGDKVLWVICPECGAKEKVRLIDLIRWARFKAQVEDNNYKNGLGREKLIAFLNDALRKNGNGPFEFTLIEICKKHQIPGY